MSCAFRSIHPKESPRFSHVLFGPKTRSLGGVGSLVRSFDQDTDRDQEVELEITNHNSARVACFRHRQDISSLNQALLMLSFSGKYLFCKNGQGFAQEVAATEFSTSATSRGCVLYLVQISLVVRIDKIELCGILRHRPC